MGRPEKFIDLAGRTFGRWTVVRLSRRDTTCRHWWLCRCQCGTERELRGGPLNSGKSNSCGCIFRDLSTTHGLSKLPEYRVWKAIKNRCYNPGATGYENYGGRGIAVCEAWRESFEAFYRDMGKRPSPLHSIDRKRNSGNYEPSNCRWVTKIDQNNNTRRNCFLAFRGRRQTVSQWAREIGMRPLTIIQRLRRQWSVDRALTAPLRRGRRRHVASP